MLFVRPKVTDLVLNLYGRALHPELFEIRETRIVERGDYRAVIDITTMGHVVKWRHKGMTLTEVATSAKEPLPQKRRVLSTRFKGESGDRIKCRGGITYNYNLQLERASPKVFWSIQRELNGECEFQGMFHRFQTTGRMNVGAVSYISIETRAKCLMIQAFHTFPDDYAIVKTQSMFQIP